MNAYRKMSESSTEEFILECGRLAAQGNIEEAEKRLCSEIKRNPSLPELYSNLALAKIAKGCRRSAKQLLNKAISLDPNHYHSLYQLGILAFQENNLQESEALIRSSLLVCADSSEAMNSLAIVQMALGNYTDAERLSIEACQAEPANTVFVINYSSIQEKKGKHTQAAAALVKYSAEYPETEETLIHLGRIMKTFEDPVNAFNDILNELSSSLEVELLAHVRARYLLFAGHADIALLDIYYLLSCEKHEHQALALLMQAYYDMNDFHEAARAGLKILRKDPQNLAALGTVGLSYYYLNKVSLSIRVFEKALRVHPKSAGILTNLAIAIMRGGVAKRSISLYKRALDIDPSNREAFYNLMFAFSISGVDLNGAMIDTGQTFWKANANRVSNIATSDRETHIPASLKLSTSSSKKLNVGVLSSDLGNHCVGHFLTGILKDYDRRLLHLELISPRRRFESMEEGIMAFADAAYSLQGSTIEEARSILRSRQYDAIVECNGYTDRTGIELLADRCAPIQAHYIGYHASTAIPAIDYFITDGIVVGHGMDALFTERIYRMQRTWLAMAYRNDMPIAKSIASVHKPILGFFGQCAKITDECIFYWSAAARAVPESILLLKDKSLGDRGVAKVLIGRLEESGIAADRILILPSTANWADHMNCYNAVDIALDSTPWSSATTAFDALGMGVPLMAIQGMNAASRMSSSVVYGADRPDWICKTPEQYASLTRSLCNQYQEIRNSKRELQQLILSGPLYDTASMAREFEKALFSIVETRGF